MDTRALIRTLILPALLALTLWGPGCGGDSTIKVSSPSGATAIGSPFPSDLEIREIAGMGTSAWVVTSTPPIGLYRFDITEPGHPYRFDFFDLSATIEGIPDELVIVDDETALITTSAEDAVFEVDPTSGAVRAAVFLDAPVPLPRPARDSGGRLVSEVTPDFASGAALVRDRLYVTTSNLRESGTNPVNDPGTILVFVRDDDIGGPTYRPARTPVIVTTGFNPTEITRYGNDLLLVTNAGVLALRGGGVEPLTGASVDILDTTSDRIVGTIPLGRTGPSFKPIAITADWERGFLGSAAYNHLYELDLSGLNRLIGTGPFLFGPPSFPERVRAGEANPIVMTGDPAFSSEFTVQAQVSPSGAVVLATAFNSGTLGVADLGEVPARAFADTIRVTDPSPSLNEVGPGAFALRPGRRGIDYEGPDLFVLTGSPTGLLVTLETPF